MRVTAAQYAALVASSRPAPQPIRDERPILLDLYCCEGGAARGYQDAGFLVLGVDLDPKYAKRYAGDGFLAMSALDALEALVTGGALVFAMRTGGYQTVYLRDLAAVHASPPCQHASAGTRALRSQGAIEYPALIPPTRDLLKQTGLPWVIENVKGADLHGPLTLCWSMFHEPGAVLDSDGEPLRMERHRGFESNIGLTAPGPCRHPADVQVAGSYGGARREGDTPAERRHNARTKRKGGYVPDVPVQRALLGIDWMTTYGMYQSLPPVYTEHVGRQLLAHSAGER